MSLSADDCRQLDAEFRSKLKILSSSIWDNKANGPQIDAWISNFKGAAEAQSAEKTYALYLLSRLMYYGQREMRALLVCLYQDLFRYPIYAANRRLNSDTRDLSFLEHLFSAELDATRFIGLGGASKSGEMLTYYFRQENGLPLSVFTNTDAILSGNLDHIPPKIRRYVFIDDLCGTGNQALGYSNQCVKPIRNAYQGQSFEIFYFTLFATETALSKLREPGSGFDQVETVHVLDESFRCFAAQSRYFPAKNSRLELAIGKKIALQYGSQLSPSPLGFEDSQLLLSFFYNTPDNTLPIFWSKENAWIPIVNRS